MMHNEVLIFSKIKRQEMKRFFLSLFCDCKKMFIFIIQK